MPRVRSIVLLFMAVWAADARRVHPSPADFGSSSQGHKYKIDFHPAESPVPPTSDQEIVLMTDRDARKFRCNVPVPESVRSGQEEGLPQNVTSTSLVVENLSSRKTPEDLLDALKDKCFRRYEGWWIYELCYKGHLRQFHLHDKKIVQEFVLGTFDAEATAALHDHSPNVTLQKDPRSQNAVQRYHAHVYTNGTICDLTNQPRETEVRFVCSETGRALINSIKEAPSCKYTVVFHAPMLCKHAEFQEERQPWVVIDCNAVPPVVVPAEDETASAEPEVDAVTHDSPESPNQTPPLPLPQTDPIPVLGLSTKSPDNIQVLTLREEGAKVTAPPESSHESEEPATVGEENVEEPVALQEKTFRG